MNPGKSKSRFSLRAGIAYHGTPAAASAIRAGRSNYDYETLTDDLRRLVLTPGLQDLALVGFSTGGGEVVRYCGRYGTEHVRAAAFVSSVTPFLLKRADNPDGIDPSLFAGMCGAIGADRLAFSGSGRVPLRSHRVPLRLLVASPSAPIASPSGSWSRPPSLRSRPPPALIA